MGRRCSSPTGGLQYDEKGRRGGAKLCIVQWQNGRPVAVYPESIAHRSGGVAENSVTDP